MVGNNKMDLNEGTMIEIVQQWIDRTMKEPPRVKSVRASRNSSANVFDVQLESSDE